MIALDGFVFFVAVVLIGAVATVMVRMITKPGRETRRANEETARAARAEQAIHDVLVYANARADVEPVARVVVDNLKRAGYTL